MSEYQYYEFRAVDRPMLRSGFRDSWCDHLSPAFMTALDHEMVLAQVLERLGQTFPAVES